MMGWEWFSRLFFFLLWIHDWGCRIIVVFFSSIHGFFCSGSCISGESVLGLLFRKMWMLGLNEVKKLDEAVCIRGR